MLDLDLAAGRVVREMQAWQWREDVIAHETHELVENLYSEGEVVALLDRAGFVDIEVVGGYHGGPPNGDEQFLVYVATRPRPSGRHPRPTKSCSNATNAAG